MAETGPDRYLVQRGGVYQYKRRVPARVAHLDERAPQIRQSLRTADLAKARALRDVHEAADDELWSALLLGEDDAAARAQYMAARRRAEALGFRYRPAAALADAAPWDELAARFEQLLDPRSPRALGRALAGFIEQPRPRLSQALKLYLEEIAAPQLVGKSEQQRRKWRVIPQRAVDQFIALVGDKAIGDIGRDDALMFWRFWQGRIAPAEKGAVPSHTASSGNRQVGALRTVYAEYFAHLGERDRPNPFDGLSFSERKARTRPAWPVPFITGTLLKPGALAGLNAEARGILFAVLETGARPSEICSLEAGTIFADAEVPYIRIMPSRDPAAPRQLKTEASERDLPLVGLALAVFKAHPAGFPTYRDKAENASATINKFLRENGLGPTPAHTLYGLRHSFEDRMKEAGIDEEMRRILFGHRRGREAYGEGGSLKWRQSLLQRLELPFDPSIV